MDKRVCIHVHSRRRRLTDPDGLYFKAALDGLVAGKLLVDDNAECVKKISFSQEKSTVEQTTIEIRRVT